MGGERNFDRMCYVYVLYSSKYDRFYISITNDINVRLKTHNSGGVKSTKAYMPWRVVYKEVYKNKMEARIREKYLKSAAGRRWRKNNIDKGD